MRKLSRNENVTTDIIGRICVALDCKVEDIMDFIQENNE